MFNSGKSRKERPESGVKRSRREPEAEAAAGPVAESLVSPGSNSADDGERPADAGVDGAESLQNWRVTVARDLSTAYLDFEPQHGVESPSARAILDKAIELGVSAEVLFSEEKLERAIRNTLHSSIPLKTYAISEDLDASFVISVSDDKLRAELTATKGRGRGRPLDLKELGAAIRASRLKGMDLERVKHDILAFYRGGDLSLEHYLLSQGTAAEPIKPRELTWEVDFLSDADVEKLKQRYRESVSSTPELESFGEKPLADISEMAWTKPDSIIVTLSPADPGKPGVDVYGASIAPPARVDAQIRTLENVRFTRDRDAIVSDQQGVLDRWIDEAGCPVVRVRPFRDAELVVNISKDAMLASVKLTEGIGSGIRLSSELVRQTLIEREVIKGIDLDAIEEAVRRAVEEEDDSEIVVARGKAPVEPGESRIRFHVKLSGGKGVTIRSDGTADFKNQDRITNVEAEQPIAEIIADSMEIVDGWDVRSNVIKAKDAPPLNIEIGDGIRRENVEGGLLRLVAERSGELNYDGKALSIGEIHTIKGDVGPSTGNVKFGGSVNITGSLHGGYFVMSKGTVKIAEGVDASLVSADESIHIAHGVKGAGKAVLRARQEISAGFAEQARLMAIGNIIVQNTCLHCTIRCNGALSLVTEKGKLVGGVVQAREGVSAAQIGSTAGVQTHISFGQDYLIGDKIELEEKEIAGLQSELVRLEGVIHAAERDQVEKDLRTGRARKVQLLKLVEKRSERLFWLRERFEQHFDSKIVVRGTIYPGVSLESHGRMLEITTERKNVSFTFDLESGRIIEIEGTKAKE